MLSTHRERIEKKNRQRQQHQKRDREKQEELKKNTHRNTRQIEKEIT